MINRRHLILAGASLAALPACSQGKLQTVGNTEARVKELGIELPQAPKPVANYVGYRRAGDTLYIAGQGPDFKNPAFRGRLGESMSIEQGYAAARSAALNTLAQVRAGAGSLDNVIQCLKLEGFINSADDFTDQPKVLNGASDVFTEVFGDAGRPARYAVGVNTLPFNVSVEISSIWQIKT